MRIVRLAGCALAVMAVSTACTTSTEPQAPAPTSAAPTTEHGSYAQCLAEHGIEGATPLGPPPGVDPAVWDEATAACADHAPGPAS
ncbi:hypothetical protein MMUR_62440 [Mycolicibacterium murale]|uniref:Lipoprotein n=1 Tax=Mycolicibacterium murale TaxID=182220 RepID=A0A7I9WXF3_9MYCO|nr:hypothetical protein [Mycolicibacterium murale]GFG62108.1 hypothetical protein MMUR_62440 [Mycolicibacterium murale]